MKLSLQQLLVLWACYVTTRAYLIGRGITDVTGLVSEGGLYGYGRLDQDARGLHTRQYARTFIICDVTDQLNTRGKCVVIVTAEITMSTQALHREVMERLEGLYGDLYTEENVLISATHSHAVPGGINTHWVYAQPTHGFINQTFTLYADGIVKSIARAHEDLAEGHVLYNVGDLLDASANRSPYAYEQNPQQERARYAHDVDKTMHVLKFTRQQHDLGMLNLFPVHATSMKNRNHLISGDNKGLASQLWEHAHNPTALPGQGEIIGAFAQTAEGDVTPNIAGDFCARTRARCHYRTSTCKEDPADPTLCNSEGPAGEQFEDTHIIGERQHRKAQELYSQAGEEIQGSVDHRHVWVDMTSQAFTDPETGEEVHTCKPALGYSFAAGATDGPGVRPFTQAGTVGGTMSNDVIGYLIDMFLGGSAELRACQAPKPVAIPSGEFSMPYKWQPEVVLVQLLKVGHLYLIGLPAEVTTMAGRRLSEAVERTLAEQGITGVKVIVMALANGYTGYITTREEYNVQRYEGAATAYGPHTLTAYTRQLHTLAAAMATHASLDPGTPPPDLRGMPAEALGVLLQDRPPYGAGYGHVMQDAQEQYSVGDMVTVKFAAGNPRAAAEAGDNEVGFVQVQRLEGESWTTVYNEASWQTRFTWESECHDVTMLQSLWRGCGTGQRSHVLVTWYTRDAMPGTYRVQHCGYASVRRDVTQHYCGVSSRFLLLV